jgi:hypothetical protein
MSQNEREREREIEKCKILLATSQESKILLSIHCVLTFQRLVGGPIYLRKRERKNEFRPTSFFALSLFSPPSFWLVLTWQLLKTRDGKMDLIREVERERER